MHTKLNLPRPKKMNELTVDAVHEYLVNPGGFESVLILNEAGNLSCGSGGGEGTGKADDDGLATFGKLR